MLPAISLRLAVQTARAAGLMFRDVPRSGVEEMVAAELAAHWRPEREHTPTSPSGPLCDFL